MDNNTYGFGQQTAIRLLRMTGEEGGSVKNFTENPASKGRVVRVPTGGIPARSGVVCSKATCTMYEMRTADGNLVSVGRQIEVYNLADEELEADSFVGVLQSIDGTWVASGLPTPPSEPPPDPPPTSFSRFLIARIVQNFSGTYPSGPMSYSNGEPIGAHPDYDYFYVQAVAWPIGNSAVWIPAPMNGIPHHNPFRLGARVGDNVFMGLDPNTSRWVLIEVLPAVARNIEWSTLNTESRDSGYSFNEFFTANEAKGLDGPSPVGTVAIYDPHCICLSMGGNVNSGQARWNYRQARYEVHDYVRQATRVTGTLEQDLDSTDSTIHLENIEGIDGERSTPPTPGLLVNNTHKLSGKHSDTARAEWNNESGQWELYQVDQGTPQVHALAKTGVGGIGAASGDTASSSTVTLFKLDGAVWQTMGTTVTAYNVAQSAVGADKRIQITKEYGSGKWIVTWEEC
jgi:hypothetical protein